MGGFDTLGRSIFKKSGQVISEISNFINQDFITFSANKNHMSVLSIVAFIDKVLAEGIHLSGWDLLRIFVVLLTATSQMFFRK